MDGRGRFALTQALKEGERRAKAGPADDLYAALQRNHRKLNRCRIRASEVDVRTSYLDLDQPAAPPSPRRAAVSGALQKTVVKPPSRSAARRTPCMEGQQEGGAFALPSYIVEMNKELLEDDFAPPDADRVASPTANDVGLTDLFPGLGEAAAAILDGAASTALVGEDQLPAAEIAPLAELLMHSLAASGTPRNGTASRSARERLLPAVPKFEKVVAKGKKVNSDRPATAVDGGVPRTPIVEMMPQHLASDYYKIRRPTYVSAQQVRWEKRDGKQSLVAMRNEIVSKCCVDGASRRIIQTAAMNASYGFKVPAIGPAEAKIRASERSWVGGRGNTK